jgi:hypothetical protein
MLKSINSLSNSNMQFDLVSFMSVDLLPTAMTTIMTPTAVSTTSKFFFYIFISPKKKLKKDFLNYWFLIYLFFYNKQHLDNQIIPQQ